MTKSTVLGTLIFFNVLLSIITALQFDCSRTEYERCTKMADPLIKEARLIFPDNINDVDLVCRTWNNFVDCLKKYTDRCFTEQQRRQFNKAVENPIESVHQMCTQSKYQEEYLQHAPCMKSTVIDSAHCGPYYSLLVDQVEQGEVISKATLCCSHDRFKQCVLRETKQMCDHGVENGPAARFSGQIINKALSFLQDQCFNYIPNSGDCSITTDTIQISPSPSEIYPWSTTQFREKSAKELPADKLLPPRSTTTTWLPTSSSIIPEDTSSLNTPHATQNSEQNLGSRTRPASYGRASSWANLDVIQSTPSGATVSTWSVVNPSPEVKYESTESSLSSSTTWYPAAGSQLTNEVDEPNQLGLVKPEQNEASSKVFSLSLILVAFVLLNRF